MDCPLDLQIRNEVSRYLSHTIVLDKFYDWFVPRSWDIERSGNVLAIALAHRIDGLLAEASSAQWSEEELRQELARAVPRLGSYAVSIDEGRCAAIRAFRAHTYKRILPRSETQRSPSKAQQRLIEIRIPAA